MVTHDCEPTDLSGLLSSEAVWRCHEPMARHTTLRVGGPADHYIEPAHEEDLARVVQYCAQSGLPWFIIGRGSNLLVHDGGIRGVVLALVHPHFTSIQVEQTTLQCGAGAKLKQIAHQARTHGVAGLEFLEGIPGTLGGALRMNAGAMGACLFDVARTVRFMEPDGRIDERSGSEMAAEYRRCPFLEKRLALGATLTGHPDAPEVIAERMKQYSEKRWESQPAAPSAGCMFKNPATMPAGQLVETLGLKGLRVGNAMISEVHGNFIVNQGNARATDVLDLMGQVREQARAQYGIDLESEVQIVGDGQPAAPPSTS